MQGLFAGQAWSGNLCLVDRHISASQILEAFGGVAAVDLAVAVDIAGDVGDICLPQDMMSAVVFPYFLCPYLQRPLSRWSVLCPTKPLPSHCPWRRRSYGNLVDSGANNDPGYRLGMRLPLFCTFIIRSHIHSFLKAALAASLRIFSRIPLF